MKVIVCDQGSEEWHFARCGVITASNFVTIRSRLKTGPNKGGFSAAAEKYAFRVALERIGGVPLDEGFQSFAMRRGNDLEPMAREEHELRTGHFVERAGFVLSDCGKFGASADGLIDEDGGSEYKCLIDPDRIKSVLLNDDLSEFMDQIQGCMWITKRQWWHFGLYLPALKCIGKQLYLRHVKRDDAYINALQKDLLEFEQLVSRNETTIRNLQVDGAAVPIAA